MVDMKSRLGDVSLYLISEDGRRVDHTIVVLRLGANILSRLEISDGLYKGLHLRELVRGYRSLLDFTLFKIEN